MVIWTFAIWIIWLRAHTKLLHRGPYEIPNRYQGAILLSQSISEDFAEHQKPTAMNNKDFADYYSKTLRGGAVRCRSVRSPVELTPTRLWHSTKRWFEKEKWWFIALAVDTVWMGTGWMAVTSLLYRYYFYYYDRSLGYFDALLAFYLISWWAWPSIVFALMIGTTTKSRLFFISCWVAIGVGIWVPFVLYES